MAYKQRFWLENFMSISCFVDGNDPWGIGYKDEHSTDSEISGDYDDSLGYLITWIFLVISYVLIA